MLLWLDDVYDYRLRRFITPNINTNQQTKPIANKKPPHRLTTTN